MEEKWLPIAGFEGLYEVSNLGRVKSLERTVINNGGKQIRHEKILKQNLTNRHRSVVLCKDGKTYPRLVHRLVAIAFIPNPDSKPVVDHIDTDTENNCVDNLRWATVKENCNNELTRKHSSEAKAGHPYWGRPLTEEEKEKISKANKGRTFSDSHKKALSVSHKNSVKAIEAAMINVKKATKANTGGLLSEETKEKIRQKLTGVHKGKTWKLVDGKRVWYDKENDI